MVLLEYGEMNGYSKFHCIKHDYIWEGYTVNLIRSGRGCPICWREFLSESKKFSYGYVKDYIENDGCKLISDNYKSVDEKLLINFKCGHKELISFYAFKSGSRCPICGKKKGGESKRLGIEDVKQRVYNEKGIKILEVLEEYAGNKTKVKSICSNNHIEIHTINNLLYEKYGCRECANNAVSLSHYGDKNNFWNGGKYGITKFLKQQTKSWIKKSLENCNYKCSICGISGNLDVHHLNNFSNLVERCFVELNLEKREVVADYEISDIYKLIEKIREIHAREPLGKAICRTHHTLFHSIYGQHDNTQEQFDEFVFALKNMKYQ